MIARTRLKRALGVCWRMFALALLVLAAGCSGVEMKGTPFFTGEYTKREGPPEDRVNLWPVLYYRDPALSAVWPLIELTDEHFAVRPLFSVYELDKDKHVYNVLWPIVQFDRLEDTNRVFPVFWWGGEKAESYRVAFPLYWHFGQPYGGDKRGLDTLFPLWWFRRSGADFSAFVLWPFLHAEREGKSAGWHAWPLAGNYWGEDGYRRYALWPLMRQWSANSVRERGQSIFPLYWYSADENGATLLTPLWGRSTEANIGLTWHYVFPAYFYKQQTDRSFLLTPLGTYGTDGPQRSWFLLPALSGGSWDADRNSWFAVPLLSGGSRDKERRSGVLLASLIAWTSSKDAASHRVLPFYMYSRGPEGTTFLSLPWSQGPAADGGSWQLLPPFFFHRSGPGGEMLATPVWANGRSKDGANRWHAVIPFYLSTKSGDVSCFATLLGGTRTDAASSNWLFWPLLAGGKRGEKSGGGVVLAGLGAWGWDERSRWHQALPFYRYSSDAAGSAFLSIPWSQGWGADGSEWQLVPPLFFHNRDAVSENLFTPLWAQGRSNDGKTRWSTLVPLYFSAESGGQSWFVTPLGGTRADATGRHWLVPPLLSWGSSGAGTGDLWFGGPLIHAQWDKDSSSNHVLPLYYWDGRDQTFLSLLAAQWHGAAGARTTAIVPALSWLSETNGRDDLWLVGPVAHFSWGADRGPEHVFPVYYRNPKTGTFLSALGARWQNGDGSTTHLFPPAVSWLSADAQSKNLWLLGPTAHFSWGADRGPEHVFPLYYRNPKTGTFLSALGARWQNGDGSTTHLFPPAVSWLSSDAQSKNLWLVGPAAHFGWGADGAVQHVLPLFYHNARTGTFVSAAAATWASGGRRWWLAPPLLSAYSTEGTERDLWGLLGLFRQNWGAASKPSRGHLLPLYVYKGGKYFYTPLAGWKKSDDGFVYPLTPLVGVRTGKSSGGWLFPLFSHERNRATGDTTGSFLLWGSYARTGDRGGSRFFPFYSYENHGHFDPAATDDSRRTYGSDFFCLPVCWHSDKTYIWKGKDGRRIPTTKKESGAFPLWSYSRSECPAEKRLDVSGRVLLLFYDYVRQVRPSHDKPGETDEYVRSRVLWRLWHYERSNGDVAVDVFPAITYDKKKDGFKSMSFLWRFFRYERVADGGRKLDLLFIPLLRTKGDKPAPLNGPAPMPPHVPHPSLSYSYSYSLLK